MPVKGALPGKPVVTISSVPAKSYRVEYLDALAQTSAWTPIATVRMDAATAEVIDPAPARNNGQRFYRAVEVERP